MGGNFDYTGIGEGLGDLGRAIVAHRQATLDKREAEQERLQREIERKKALRLDAAQKQWELVKGLKEGDPQREAAARELEAAARDYFGTQFTIPKKKITVGRQTATVGTPPRGMEGLEAPRPGQKLPQQTIVTSEGQEQEVYNLPGAEPEIDDERVLQAVRNFQNAIANAAPGEARRLALAQANTWKQAITQRYPQVAHLIPDFESTARTFDDEERRAAAQRLALEGQKKWETALAAAEKQLQSAFAGTDPIALITAIKARRELLAAGKQAGYRDTGAFDNAAQLAEIRNILTAWAAKITDPQKLYAILPVLAQFGIKPTKNQQKLIDLMLKQKSGGGGSGNRVVEDTGL